MDTYPFDTNLNVKLNKNRMKNKSIFGIMALGLAVSFASCSKCEECHYDTADGTEVEIGELCDDALKDAEENGCAVGDTTYTLHCHEH